MHLKEVYEQPLPPIAGYTLFLSAMEAATLTKELRKIEAETENLPLIQTLYHVLKHRRAPG